MCVRERYRPPSFSKEVQLFGVESVSIRRRPCIFFSAREVQKFLAFAKSVFPWRHRAENCVILRCSEADGGLCRVSCETNCLSAFWRVEVVNLEESR